MKLEPKAKPIRIRIKLGDSEHSSLDSVKDNFSIEELYPLFKDGRLERWLRQIGEIVVADKVQAISGKCGDGGLQDHILFLSVFFKEVADSLHKDGFGEDFFDNVSFDVLKIVFRHTKDTGGVNRKEYLDKYLSKSQLIPIFEDSVLHSVYSDKGEWGMKFASLVENYEDYKRFFDYVEKAARTHPEYEDILGDYFYSTKNDGYDWKNTYNFAECSLDDIVHIYQHKCLQKVQINWGNVFADAIRDWDAESHKVETLLKSNRIYLNTFYMRCIAKGIESAKYRLDPWIALVNSKDYGDVMKALKKVRDYGRAYYNKAHYNHNKMETLLGKEIFGFIHFLVYGVPFSFTDSFLKDEKEVMIEVKKDNDISSTHKSIRLTLLSKKKLQAMRVRGVELAEYVVVYGGASTYEDVVRYAIRLIIEKLDKYRR